MSHNTLVDIIIGTFGDLTKEHKDMISILDHLHQYVPLNTTTKSMQNPHTSESITQVEDHFHHILFGGDFLTAKRARGSQEIRANSDRGRDRLEGFIPVAEDWHTKMCLLCVSACMVYRVNIYYCIIMHAGCMEKNVQVCVCSKSWYSIPH